MIRVSWYHYIMVQEILIIFGILASVFWMIQILCSAIVIRNQKKQQIKSNLPPISVIVPTYNEPIDRVVSTIESILNQKNVALEIIVVDDGSTEPVVLDYDNVRVIRTENRGKRHAQITGIEIAKHDWIATIDSDTSLDENAIAYLITTILDENLDAATGSVFLSNEKTNMLTKMTSCMYWFSFYQERASQSLFKSVMCCSGALSVYSKEIILKHKEDYLNQTFFGHVCAAGDDRHLTNLFLLSGKTVGWSKNSKAWTHSPDKIGKFIKQQLRWIRSHVSSFYYIGKRIASWNIIFAIFTVKLIFRYAYMLLLYFSMFSESIHNLSLWPFIIALISVVIVTVIKTIIALMYTRKKEMAYLLAYSVYTFFIFNPVVFYGILTPTKVGWLTRNSKNP